MPGESRLCAIVDAYSSGSLLPGLLAGYGVGCVHVQSMQPMPAVYAPSFRPGDFRVNVVHAGSIEETAAVLRSLGVTDLLVGAECGVLLFDRLAAALGLPGNDPALSRARRDKYEMQETLRRAGLAAIDQIRSADLDQILEWARAAGRWPVVLKPLDSAGSDGVTFCNDEEEVRRAFAALIGATNRLGSRNDEVLAQACVRGQEYVVNAVSRDGRPHFSEIWQINKTLMPGGNLVYDHGILLEARGAVQDALTGYVSRVLEALGIRNGASHSELMLTERGPVLIEIGARLAGSISHRTTSRAVGCSHASLLAEAWFDEDRFRARAAAPYLRREHERFVSLISHQSGTIAGLKRLHDVFGLPSFSQAVNCPKAGDAIRPTEDLFTSPGLIYLVDPDPAVVEADHRRIRQWEAEGFFELAGA
jgi:biotin carboxylase